MCTDTCLATPAHALRRSREQRRGLRHGVEQRPDLLCSEHGGDAAPGLRAPDTLHPWQFDAEHFLVQKEDRANCLMMRRNRNLALVGEVAQEGLHLGTTQLARVPKSVPANEKARPVDVRLFGSYAVI